MPMKVHIDQTICTGCELCAAISPDLFEINGEGVSQAKLEDVPGNLIEECCETADTCPVEAIRIDDRAESKTS